MAVTANGQDPDAGGLVGSNTGSGLIMASYATGAVAATASEDDDVEAGGLVGTSVGGVDTSYATGDAAATASGKVATPPRAASSAPATEP